MIAQWVLQNNTDEWKVQAEDDRDGVKRGTYVNLYTSKLHDLRNQGKEGEEKKTTIMTWLYNKEIIAIQEQWHQ